MEPSEQRTSEEPVGGLPRIVDRGATPAAPTVASIMTRAVHCVDAGLGIEELGRLFLQHKVSGFPVIGAGGRPLGVVSKTDLLEYLQEHAGEVAIAHREEAEILAELGGGFHAVHVESAAVRDIMMPVVFSLPGDAPIARAAALMAGERVHRLPILDANGDICGILSTLDIVRWVATEAGYPTR